MRSWGKFDGGPSRIWSISPDFFPSNTFCIEYTWTTFKFRPSALHFANTPSLGRRLERGRIPRNLLSTLVPRKTKWREFGDGQKWNWSQMFMMRNTKMRLFLLVRLTKINIRNQFNLSNSIDDWMNISFVSLVRFITWFILSLCFFLKMQN